MKQMAILIIMGLFLGIALVFMDGPENKDKPLIITETKISSKSNIKKVVIDSCEYICWGHGLAHKGNCKFCANRRREELKMIDELNKEE